MLSTDHQLLQENLKFFEKSNFLQKIPDLASSLDKARLIRESCDPTSEYASWLSSPEKIALPWFLPSSLEQLEGWKDVDSFSKVVKDDISSIIDCHDDIHVVSFAHNICQILSDVGCDVTNTAYNLKAIDVKTLICFGTGDGQAVQWLISLLNPQRIVFFVDDWHEIISSFSVINWQSMYSHFSENNRSICLMKVHSAEEILNETCKHSLFDLDTTAVYRNSESCAVAYEDYYKSLDKDDRFKNLVYYQGYTVDEYNMIINTVSTLQKTPLILNQPQQSHKLQNICICGSGPSLDSSLEFLRSIQETHLIVCGGSSVKTLLKNNIRVDVVVLVERAQSMSEAFIDPLQYCPKDRIPKLVMSSTCPSELVDAYKDTAIFFRPALTPLSIFSNRPQQVLSNEGPEAVNAALSFACRFTPNRVIFVGVDLGSLSSDDYRSKDAAGDSPRDLTMLVPSNLDDQKEVYTNKIFQDTRLVLEQCISLHSRDDLKFFNVSDGCKIKGTISMTMEEYKINSSDLKGNSQDLSSWWSSLAMYDSNLMKQNWQSRSPRETTYKFLKSVQELIHSCSDSTVYIDNVAPKICEMMTYQLSLKSQLPPRMFKGAILKYLLITIQSINLVKSQDHSKLDQYFTSLKSLLLQSIDSLVDESIALYDFVESSFQTK